MWDFEKPNRRITPPRFDTRGILGNSTNVLDPLPAPPGDAFYAFTKIGRLGRHSRTCPITSRQWSPQVLEKAEPRFVNSDAHNQMFLGRRFQSQPERAAFRQGIGKLSSECFTGGMN